MSERLRVIISKCCVRETFHWKKFETFQTIQTKKREQKLKNLQILISKRAKIYEF